MGTAHRIKEGLPTNGSVASYAATDALRIELGSPQVGADLVRRALDIVISALVLTVLAPLMIVIALLVKRQSLGPAIFTQFRLGRGCKPFRFYKFRTMYTDWPTRFPRLADFRFDPKEMDSVYLQLADDPRISPLGRFLRNTSLDELPNFWNILRGEMTLVGPRPELPEMLPYYETLEKFEVKPGVTGMAQICGRGALNFPDTVRLDVDYVRDRSLRLDFRILVGTVRAVLGQAGAY